jgi:Domain of unknown function (DUF397)
MTATREWFKSSFSLSGVDCVEVRHLPGGGVVVRDTKAGGAGPVLSFTAGEWGAFLAGVRAGEFDATPAEAAVVDAVEVA